MIAALLVACALATEPTPTLTPEPSFGDNRWSVDPKSGVLMPGWAKDSRAGNPKGIAAWKAYWRVLSETPPPTPTETPELDPDPRPPKGWAFVESPGGGKIIRIDPKAWAVYGVWLVTATVTVSPTPTVTPKPNPEATCVVKGHDWRDTQIANVTWAIINICETGERDRPWPCCDSQLWYRVQCCHRCGLWREKP